MTIHATFPRSVPSCDMPPIVRRLVPRTMDGILDRRRFSDAMADRALKKTKLDYWFAARQGDFSHRIDARIAQVAK